MFHVSHARHLEVLEKCNIEKGSLLLKVRPFIRTAVFFVICSVATYSSYRVYFLLLKETEVAVIDGHGEQPVHYFEYYHAGNIRQIFGLVRWGRFISVWLAPCVYRYGLGRSRVLSFISVGQLRLLG